MEERNKIENYIENDRLNLEKIVDEYSGYVHKVVKNMVGKNITEEDEEEIIADTFFILWKNTEKLDKEINTLRNQKSRIKEAYLKEIVDVEEFSKEYKAIDEKLELLEQKRIETIDLNKQSFSPQYLMADRDVEKKANPF